MRSFFHDLRYAFRNVRNRAGFAAIFILSLAIATGANIAMFAIFYSVLINPLPYSQPDLLYVIWEDASHQGFPESASAPANYLDWKKESRSFSNMAAYFTDSAILTGQGHPVTLRAAWTSASLFDVLGRSQVARGRVFTQSEDHSDAAGVCLLSFRFWRTSFGGEDSILNQTILLNENPVRVIGVLPEDFVLPEGDVDLVRPRMGFRDAKKSRGSLLERIGKTS